MPTEPTGLIDGPVTEEPVAPVTKKPADLAEEPETEDHVAPVTKKFAFSTPPVFAEPPRLPLAFSSFD